MKHLLSVFPILVLTLGAAVAAHAQTKDMDMKDMHKGMDMKSMDSGKGGQGTTHKGRGTVKKIDAAKGAVTLSHEPIKSANWSAMTMTFNVKDRKMLENLKNEQKVQFEFVQQGKENVITSIK